MFIVNCEWSVDVEVRCAFDGFFLCADVTTTKTPSFEIIVISINSCSAALKFSRASCVDGKPKTANRMFRFNQWQRNRVLSITWKLLCEGSRVNSKTSVFQILWETCQAIHLPCVSAKSSLNNPNVAVDFNWNKCRSKNRFLVEADEMCRK